MTPTDPTNKTTLLDVDDLMGLIWELLQTDSQSELARVAGVTRQHIYEVVNGIRKPGPKLAAALGFEQVVMYRPKTPSTANP